jgi:hypothetical protein
MFCLLENNHYDEAGMKPKTRSPGQTALSISMELGLRSEIRIRARNLNLNVSQYLATLAKNDIADGGNLELRETNSTPNSGGGVVAHALDAVSGVAATPAIAPRRAQSNPKVAPRSKARPVNDLLKKGKA